MFPVAKNKRREKKSHRVAPRLRRENEEWPKLTDDLKMFPHHTSKQSCQKWFIPETTSEKLFIIRTQASPTFVQLILMSTEKMWHWKIISLSLYKCLCAENQPKQSCLFSSLFFSIHFRLTITTCNYNSEWRNRVLPPNEYLSGHESQLWPLAAVRSISLPLLFNNFISAYLKWKGCPVFSKNVLLNVIESISLMRSEEESQKQCLK